VLETAWFELTPKKRKHVNAFNDALASSTRFVWQGIRGQGNFFDDQMPNHCRPGSETATAFDFAACRKQHSLSPKRTPPLLPIQAAQARCHLTAPPCSSGREKKYPDP
jgi:hypothetical protein